MPFEFTALGLAALLQVVQIGLAGASMHRDDHSWNAGPRDRDPEFSPRTLRLRRAVNNHFEALIFFTIAVVLTLVADTSGALSASCAALYLCARVLYIPAYALGWNPWRSVIWFVGMAATLVMIIAALTHTAL